MQVITLPLLAAFASLGSAYGMKVMNNAALRSVSATSTLRRCGTAQVPPGVDAMLADDAVDINTRLTEEALSNITIPTYFHFVYSSAAANNTVPDYNISAQLDALNYGFRNTPFHFELENVTSSVNDTWSWDGDEVEMKKQLRQGGYDALNVYFLTDLIEWGVYGITTPPNVTATGDDLIMDGCLIWTGTMPGGETSDANLGYTTVHEAGHWLSLYHVWGYNCTTDADLVEDTPVQRMPTVMINATTAEGCPVMDSCSELPGLDNVNNYMDYSADFCYEAFTLGQVTRMVRAYHGLRYGK